MLTEKLKNIPISLLVIISLTLGLAPFSPEPHLVQKLRLLTEGGLNRPIDIFDLLMHGAPIVLLGLRLALTLMTGKSESE